MGHLGCTVMAMEVDMKSCISMWSFEGLLSSGKTGLEGPFEYAASQGIGAVEVLDYYLKDDAGYKLAASATKRLGLEIPCLTIVCDLSTGGSAFEAQRQYILAMMARARGLGARYLRILGGDNPEKLDTASAFERIRMNAVSLLASAEAHSLTLVMENTGACHCRTVDLAATLRSVNSPLLRANFDTANPLLANEDPADSLAILKGLVSHVHLKDFRAADISELGAQVALNGECFVGCPLGLGLVDVDALVATLLTSGYDGYLSIEYEGKADETGPIDLCTKRLLALTGA